MNGCPAAKNASGSPASSRTRTTTSTRRGRDIDRAAPWRAFGDLKAADTMRPFRAPLAVASEPDGHGRSAALDTVPLPGPVTYQGDPQAVYATESLAQTLRQLEAYGRNGLPVLSDDGRHVEGWITNASVLKAVAAELGSAPAQAGQARTGEANGTGLDAADAAPPTPLAGYQVLEVAVSPGSPAAGARLGSLRWPAGSIAVSVLRHRALQDPDPGLTLTADDRISVLVQTARPSSFRQARSELCGIEDTGALMAPRSDDGDDGRRGD
jgi:CIC family chloride channel protein